ncbi:noggin-2-like [Liolophura sinensis]|uniref:noggin-2-like n=1 Tax=Liolophura sinensis TaxID=3198878 RepID=UPI003158D159
MTGLRHSGIAWIFCIIISSDLFSGTLGTFPLKSSSFQGQLRPEMTVTDNDGSTIRVVSKIANMADDLPPKKRMKKKKLLKRLGEYFDPEWMSVNQPEDALHRVASVNLSADSNLVREMSKVNLTLTHANGSVMSVDAGLMEAVRSWLIHRASCPIHYVWVDQGERWWPRWLRTGVCVDDTPCSWPPGMHCVPAENTVIHLLRWHCKTRMYPKKAWKKRFRLGGDDQTVGTRNYLKLKKDRTKLEPEQPSNSQTDELVRLLQSRRPKFRKN